MFLLLKTEVAQRIFSEEEKKEIHRAFCCSALPSLDALCQAALRISFDDINNEVCTVNYLQFASKNKIT